MPDNDLFRRSLDAGVAFTQLTRKRAETMVRELVKSGEVSRDQATTRVEELLERSRQNSEAIVAIVRKEIDDRVAALNLVTRDDLSNLATRLGLPGIPGRAPAAPPSPGRPAPAPQAKAPVAPTKPSATGAPVPKPAATKPPAPKTTPAKPTAVKKATPAKTTAATKASAAAPKPATPGAATKAVKPAKKA